MDSEVARRILEHATRDQQFDVGARRYVKKVVPVEFSQNPHPFRAEAPAIRFAQLFDDGVRVLGKNPLAAVDVSSLSRVPG